MNALRTRRQFARTFHCLGRSRTSFMPYHDLHTPTATHVRFEVDSVRTQILFLTPSAASWRFTRIRHSTPIFDAPARRSHASPLRSSDVFRVCPGQEHGSAD